MISVIAGTNKYESPIRSSNTCFKFGQISKRRERKRRTQAKFGSVVIFSRIDVIFSSRFVKIVVLDFFSLTLWQDACGKSATCNKISEFPIRHYCLGSWHEAAAKQKTTTYVEDGVTALPLRCFYNFISVMFMMAGEWDDQRC